MLTVNQLLRLTPAKVRYRASYPKFYYVRDKFDKKLDARSVYARMGLGNEESSGTPYSLNVRCFGSKANPSDVQFSPKSEIWVSCSCPYFLYHLEVALAVKGSSDYWYSNKRFPHIKNPRMKPYLCKHLYATLLYLMAKDKKDYRKQYEFLTKE